ncbi:MAG: septum formation initiator family protein [Fimbriimonadales bacterium]|nr:septum formation initiator family protein [Fimbriimonadales bacterium]
MARARRVGWWRLGLWALLLLMGAALAPRSMRIYAQWQRTRQEVHTLEQHVQALQREEAELRQQLQRLATPAGKEALAREKGWIKPGEQPLQIVPE